MLASIAVSVAESSSPTHYRHIRPNRATGEWMAEARSIGSTGRWETVRMPPSALARGSIKRTALAITPAGAGFAPAAAGTPADSWGLATTNIDTFATTSAPVLFPAFLPFATMTFNFGFTTDETAGEDELLDAFSVTFQSANGSNTMLLLTVDANGVAWAPPNPGGTLVLESELVRAQTRFATNITKLATSVSHSVTIRLPSAFIGQTGTLYLDLFDNENGRESEAYLRRLHFTPAPIFVESSSVPEGPYAEESGVILDAVARSLTFPIVGHSRFFRLRSSHTNTIHAPRPEGVDWVIRYDASAGSSTNREPPVLQSSGQAGGPYADERTARVDTSTQSIRLMRISPARFYRLRSEVPLHIRRIEVDGDNLRIIYD